MYLRLALADVVLTQLLAAHREHREYGGRQQPRGEASSCKVCQGLAVQTCLSAIVRRLVASGGCAKLCGKTARHQTEGCVLRAGDFVRFRWHFEDAQGTLLSFSDGSAVGRVIELKKKFVKVHYPFHFSGGQGKGKDFLEHPIQYLHDNHLCAAENLGDLSTGSWWSYATEAEYAAQVNNPIDQDVKLCEGEGVGAGTADDARGPDSTLVGADCPDAGSGPDCSSSACSSDGGGGGVDSSREWWCCSECNCKVAGVMQVTSHDAETVAWELARANGDANTATVAVLDSSSTSRDKRTPTPGVCAICATKKPSCATNRDGRRSRRSMPSQDSPERFCPGSLVRVKWQADGKAYDPVGTKIRWKKVGEEYQLDATDPKLELWHAVVVTDHWNAEQAVRTNKYDVIYRCQGCFDRALNTDDHESHRVTSTCAQCLKLNNENDGHEEPQVNVQASIIDLVRAAPPPGGVVPHRLSSRSATTQHRRSGPSAFVRIGEWLHLNILGEADCNTTLMDGTDAKLQEINLETVSVALAAFLLATVRCTALTVVCRLVPRNVHSLRECITCQPTIPRPPNRTADFPGQRCVVPLRCCPRPPACMCCCIAPPSTAARVGSDRPIGIHPLQPLLQPSPAQLQPLFRAGECERFNPHRRVCVVSCARPT